MEQPGSSLSKQNREHLFVRAKRTKRSGLSFREMMWGRGKESGIFPAFLPGVGRKIGRCTA